MIPAMMSLNVADGRMIALCPDCGGQDGTHTTGCVFVRAKAHIDAARAAQGGK